MSRAGLAHRAVGQTQEGARLPIGLALLRLGARALHSTGGAWPKFRKHHRQSQGSRFLGEEKSFLVLPGPQILGAISLERALEEKNMRP